MTPAAVADRLGVNTKMLERWRGTGEGPPFVRLTRKTLRYRAADVDDFIRDRVRANTAAA
jgi:predicted site-specific integrase-resolvase